MAIHRQVRDNADRRRVLRFPGDPKDELARSSLWWPGRLASARSGYMAKSKPVIVYNGSSSAGVFDWEPHAGGGVPAVPFSKSGLTVGRRSTMIVKTPSTVPNGIMMYSMAATTRQNM